LYHCNQDNLPLRKSAPRVLPQLLVLFPVFLIYFLFISPPQTYSQETPVSPAAKPDQISTATRPKAEHRFWDSTNIWLFAGTGASRALDYSSTLNMRRRGRQEILLSNDVVDNHAAFTTIEVAATGVSIGAAYIFHRTGHHKLERWTSIIHISATTAGAARNYSLKTAHPRPTPTP
jgi:hypothetical protein